MSWPPLSFRARRTPRDNFRNNNIILIRFEIRAGINVSRNAATIFAAEFRAPETDDVKFSDASSMLDDDIHVIAPGIRDVDFHDAGASILLRPWQDLVNFYDGIIRQRNPYGPGIIRAAGVIQMFVSLGARSIKLGLTGLKLMGTQTNTYGTRIVFRLSLSVHSGGIAVRTIGESYLV